MKKCVILVTMFLFTNNISAEYKKVQEIKRKVKKQLTFMECLPSTVVSSIVGAFTGGLTRYLEKELKIGKHREDIIFLVVAWWLEHRVRHTVINSLELDFYEADIPHKRGLMRFAAWASSWVSYLKV